MPYPEVIHHGAVNGVTGSCHQLSMADSHSLLVDCGLFQGAETTASGKLGIENLGIEFSLQGIKALVITHVHADHVGRLPYLLAAGFKGPILCSEPSAKLLPLVLEDAFKLEFNRDQQQLERYLQVVTQRMIALPYDTWFPIAQTPELTARIRLQRAGHILGSVYVECDLEYPETALNRRIVFSGDLGAPHTPLLPQPKSPDRADVLILESTYGDRLHQDRSTRQIRLEQAIDKALADHGTLLIPAFSIGRTQELLYELEDILHRKALNTPASDSGSQANNPALGAEGQLPVHWPELPIILDSPLASRFTAVYRDLNDYWDEEAQERLQSGRKPLHFSQLVTIDSHAQHQKVVSYLANSKRPAIVIAGSGMCSSGRIVNYLKAMLSDSRHNVVFVGYQAKGTPGAAIQKYGPAAGYVDLEGERYEIRAGVETLGGYSAHADQQGLVDFVTGMNEWPEEVRLVHGELQAKQALARVLEEHYRKAQKSLNVLLPGSQNV